MHWKLIIGFILIIICCNSVSAQEHGKVVVIMDPQIDSLIARRLELSMSDNVGNSVSSAGYRVQVWAGLGRQEGYAEQTKFKSRYPNITTYISYTRPYYRLRVGDFRSRIEAEKFMTELKKSYSSVFIFPEKINLQ